MTLSIEEIIEKIKTLTNSLKEIRLSINPALTGTDIDIAIYNAISFLKNYDSQNNPRELSEYLTNLPNAIPQIVEMGFLNKEKASTIEANISDIKNNISVLLKNEQSKIDPNQNIPINIEATELESELAKDIEKYNKKIIAKITTLQDQLKGNDTYSEFSEKLEIEKARFDKERYYTPEVDKNIFLTFKNKHGLSVKPSLGKTISLIIDYIDQKIQTKEELFDFLEEDQKNETAFDLCKKILSQSNREDILKTVEKNEISDETANQLLSLLEAIKLITASTIIQNNSEILNALEKIKAYKTTLSPYLTEESNIELMPNLISAINELKNSTLVEDERKSHKKKDEIAIEILNSQKISTETAIALALLVESLNEQRMFRLLAELIENLTQEIKEETLIKLILFLRNIKEISSKAVAEKASSAYHLITNEFIIKDKILCNLDTTLIKSIITISEELSKIQFSKDSKEFIIDPLNKKLYDYIIKKTDRQILFDWLSEASFYNKQFKNNLPIENISHEYSFDTIEDFLEESPPINTNQKISSLIEEAHMLLFKEKEEKEKKELELLQQEKKRKYDSMNEHAPVEKNKKTIAINIPVKRKLFSELKYSEETTKKQKVDIFSKNFVNHVNVLIRELYKIALSIQGLDISDATTHEKKCNSVDLQKYISLLSLHITEKNKQALAELLPKIHNSVDFIQNSPTIKELNLISTQSLTTIKNSIENIWEEKFYQNAKISEEKIAERIKEISHSGLQLNGGVPEKLANDIARLEKLLNESPWKRADSFLKLLQDTFKNTLNNNEIKTFSKNFTDYLNSIQNKYEELNQLATQVNEQLKQVLKKNEPSQNNNPKESSLKIIISLSEKPILIKTKSEPLKKEEDKFSICNGKIKQAIESLKKLALEIGFSTINEFDFGSDVEKWKENINNMEAGKALTTDEQKYDFYSIVLDKTEALNGYLDHALLIEIKKACEAILPENYVPKKANNAFLENDLFDSEVSQSDEDEELINSEEVGSDGDAMHYNKNSPRTPPSP